MKEPFNVTLTTPRRSNTEPVKRLKATPPNSKAAYMLGYSEYATSGSEATSKEQDSILQIPFSSASVPDVISANLAGKAGEKASDATECHVF